MKQNQHQCYKTVNVQNVKLYMYQEIKRLETAL